jgi:hypothetical protein
MQSGQLFYPHNRTKERGKEFKKIKNPEIQEKTNLEKDFELVVLK